MQDKNKLYKMRHSLAHLMAYAIIELWPDAKFGVGPVTADGFYYDVKIPDYSISELDFTKIEKLMNSYIELDLEFSQSELSIKDALLWAKQTNQPYKLELINDLKRSGTTLASKLTSEEMGSVVADNVSKVDKVSFYKVGQFIDLCRGPHVKSAAEVGPFKLIKVSGAYWRGNIKNDQLQRIYGVAFEDATQLEQYLNNIKEAEDRDHRKLGKELDLFLISELVGPGLPLFTPRGTILRNELITFSESLQKAAGYQAVWAPHMTRIELYKKSGHYEKYPERFDVTSSESDDKFMLKPMNCPHVIQIYASRLRSYRDLPIRYMETTTMYRDEKSGELHGLSRVRALTQDDAHAFVRPDQIKTEVALIIKMIQRLYQTLDMKISVDLSFRDESDKYFGDQELWTKAERYIQEIAQEEKLEYQIIKGEAAFYGPKIDIHVEDALKRKWQCATVQIDYVQPERFGIKYIDSDGQAKQPVMIHKALLGSIERFLSVYLEHTNGNLPTWLAPEQISIIAINNQSPIIKFCQTIVDQAQNFGLRVNLNTDNDPLGKRIHQAEQWKVPYIIVVGQKEVTSKELSLKIRRDLVDDKNMTKTASMNFLEALKSIKHEVDNRSAKSIFNK